MDREAKFLMGVWITMISFLLGGWITYSYFEAKAFNGITQSQVTTWQAMFVKLRVIEPAKQ